MILIKKLKDVQSKDGGINPDRAWVARNREELLCKIRQSAVNIQNLSLKKKNLSGFVNQFLEGLHIFVSRKVLSFAKTTMTVFLAGAIAVSGWAVSVSASYYSLPGEVLYNVKMAAEKTELIVASVIGTDEDQVTTILKHASTRVDEYQRSKSSEQASEAIKSLKKKIESTQESLNKASVKSSEKAVAVAKVVEKRTEEILDSLSGADSEDNTSNSEEDIAEKVELYDSNSELKKEIVEAEALIQKTGIQAVEVLIEKVEKVGVGEDVITKQEVKETITRKLDKIVSDVSKLDIAVGEASQKASSTIAVQKDAVIRASEGQNLEIGQIEAGNNLVSSTASVIVKVGEAEQKVVEMSKKAEETKVEVNSFIEQNNLIAALEKVKELDGLKVETKAAVVEVSEAVARASGQEVNTGLTNVLVPEVGGNSSSTVDVSVSTSSSSAIDESINTSQNNSSSTLKTN